MVTLTPNSSKLVSSRIVKFACWQMLAGFLVFNILHADAPLDPPVITQAPVLGPGGSCVLFTMNDTVNTEEVSITGGYNKNYRVTLLIPGGFSGDINVTNSGPVDRVPPLAKFVGSKPMIVKKGVDTAIEVEFEVIEQGFGLEDMRIDLNIVLPDDAGQISAGSKTVTPTQEGGLISGDAFHGRYKLSFDFRPFTQYFVQRMFDGEEHSGVVDLDLKFIQSGLNEACVQVEDDFDAISAPRIWRIRAEYNFQE